MLKIMLSATEVSGDLHAANLVKAIKRLCPETEFFGIGGEKMKEAGVEVRQFVTHMGTVGILEGVKFYPSFLKAKNEVGKILKEKNPDLLVLIDSRDFNTRLLPLAKNLGIPTVYYIAPQIWAFFDLKMRKIAKEFEKIITIFPFEDEAYRKIGADTVWVGHPLLDIVKPELTKKEAYRRFSFDPEKPIIGLFPGSREYELVNLLPLMLKVAEILEEKIKGVQYYVPAASSFFEEKISRIIRKSKIRVKIFKENIYDLMNISSLLITASGTATLEAACLGVPMVILYKTHITTYLLAHILVKLPYVGLPNILGGKRIVPELLQFKATEKNISNVCLDLLCNSDKITNMRKELKKAVEKLGPPGATEKAAKVVVEVASKRKDKVKR